MIAPSSLPFASLQRTSHQSISLLSLFLGSLCLAQTTQEGDAFSLATLQVNADRVSQPELFAPSNSGASFSSALLNGTTIAIDDLSETIARYPGYSAFRATPSRAAHPTTQGIRLRNLGINASSRTIVTLDGVPQNDPFGAWVYWQRYNPSTLSSIEIRPSSGSEAWGNFGTGGRISLQSLSSDENRLHAKLTLGTDGKRAAAFSSNSSLGPGLSINLSAIAAETDGFYTLSPDQRGAVDRKANSEIANYQGQLNYSPNDLWRISIKADTYEEDRVNGTTLGLNGTEATDFSTNILRIFNETSSGLQFVTYAQDRDFHNVFTAVAADRNSERPALDQFDMPAEAQGMNLNYFINFDNGNELMAGVDFREVEGEVHERFRNLGNGFTRLRNAGGEQTTTGVFATTTLSLSNDSWIVATARIDEVENAQGRRLEWNTETDTQIRDDQFASRKDSFFSNNLTFYRQVSDSTRFMLRHTSGFRAPTLNELYRPFRVKNDITESNQNLDTEQHSGFEAGISIDGEDERWTFSANLFHYELEDMIGNVVLSREPGFDPLCGFVPTGGLCGQRQNIPESEVEGLEITWNTTLADNFNAEFQLVYAQSDITSFLAIPSLLGNEFPHASPLRATLNLDWQPADGIAFWSSLRYRKSDYEDLENQRELDGSVQLDLGARYAISGQHALSARIENLFDSEIETGLSSAGLLSISAPRTLWISWDFSR
jgi:outer membrane cobalamin receptor